MVVPEHDASVLDDTRSVKERLCRRCSSYHVQVSIGMVYPRNAALSVDRRVEPSFESDKYTVSKRTDGPPRRLKRRSLMLTPLNRPALREMAVCIQVVVLPPLSVHLFSE
jgi:hypothetical protein